VKIVRSQEPPPFWWKPTSAMALALSPVSLIYGWGAARRMASPARSSVPVPVLCIGNFIAGGAGKTPTAIALAGAITRRGLRPGFLSRGYGGRIEGPAVVDPTVHFAADVGDEPILLAEVAPTVVSADRAAGAAMLVEQGCNFIVMDDGFQNPGLAKDFSLVVVDSGRGIGNGWTIPAGPLRAPLRAQLLKADAVLVIGEKSGADRVIRETARSGRPVHLARTRVVNPRQWKSRKVIAFTGIADPSKFFESLEAAGAELVASRPFPDHHFFTQEEARDLLALADASGAELVTTAKDRARLFGQRDYIAVLSVETQVLEITLSFDDSKSTDRIIDATIRNAEARILTQFQERSAN
jgi:tetraacyldisaccharide 4'-kinase